MFSTLCAYFILFHSRFHNLTYSFTSPETEALCRFWFFNLLPSYSFSIFVSIQYCPINRRVLEKQVKWYKRRRTKNIGALYNLQLNLALLGEAVHTRRAYRQSRAQLPRQWQKFADFFFICHASPVSGIKTQCQQYWRSRKDTKELAKRGKKFRPASPMGLKIAILLRCTDRKLRKV